MISLAALGLYVAWLGLAFGLRSLIQARRTGDTGWRFAGDRPGTAKWWTRIIAGAGAIAAGLAAPVADLAGLPTVAALDRPWLRITGLAVAALAIIATVAAQMAMGASWRIGVDETEHTALVTAGPFTLVRNPIYTAVIGLVCGLTLSVPNVIAYIGLVLVILGIELQVRRVEEPYLLHTHGERYRRYAAGVGRFLPGLGRLPAPPR